MNSQICQKNVKYILTNLRICSHFMFASKLEDTSEFRINWQKIYIIKVRQSAKTCVHPDQKDLVDTFYTRPCTDVNPDCILRLQCHQDTYISLCTKIWL